MGDHLNILLEYMDGGSLRRRLDREGPMCERQTAVVTRKVLCGLAYLHSNNITHRDIKVRRRTALPRACARGCGVGRGEGVC